MTASAWSRVVNTAAPSKRLPEEVAERKEIQDANGLEGKRQLLVLCDLALEGRQVGAEMAVPMHDALGITGSAGREDNLNDVVPRQGRELETIGFPLRDSPERDRLELRPRRNRGGLRSIDQPSRADSLLDAVDHSR
jgi:hypothetical protein